MRIATFNANSVRSRLPIILEWLKENSPDILCIQETKAVDSDFPVLDITSAGYKVFYKGEKSYNGVAILCKDKPDAVEFGFSDTGQKDETRLAYVKLGKLNVINTYVPQGRELDHAMYQYKLKWFKRLKQYFAEKFKPTDLVVWVGDLNVAPLAIDIHNAEKQAEHVCYHVDVRKALADTLSWGFTDVFRKHHPEAGQYTYYDYRTIDAVGRKMGWRVDHILATKPLADKSTDSFIDIKPRLKEKPSDHTFLVADFKM